MHDPHQEDDELPDETELHDIAAFDAALAEDGESIAWEQVMADLDRK